MKACQRYKDAFRYRFVVRLNGEIAHLHFSRRRYKEAEPLFKSTCTMYLTDRWSQLHYASRIQLAECQRQLHHYVEYCSSLLELLSTETPMNNSQKCYYINELIHVARSQLNEKVPQDMLAGFQLLVELKDKILFIGQLIKLDVFLENFLPREIKLDSFYISFTRVIQVLIPQHQPHHHSSVGSAASATSSHRFHEEEDKSGKKILFHMNDVTLQPGRNQLSFTTESIEEGKYVIDKIWMEIGNLTLESLVRSEMGANVRFVVRESHPSVELFVAEAEGGEEGIRNRLNANGMPSASSAIVTSLSQLVLGVTQHLHLSIFTNNDSMQHAQLSVGSPTGLKILNHTDTLLITNNPPPIPIKKVDIVTNKHNRRSKDLKSLSTTPSSSLTSLATPAKEKHYSLYEGICLLSDVTAYSVIELIIPVLANDRSVLHHELALELSYEKATKEKFEVESIIDLQFKEPFSLNYHIASPSSPLSSSHFLSLLIANTSNIPITILDYSLSIPKSRLLTPRGGSGEMSASTTSLLAPPGSKGRRTSWSTYYCSFSIANDFNKHLRPYELRSEREISLVFELTTETIQPNSSEEHPNTNPAFLGGHRDEGRTVTTKGNPPSLAQFSSQSMPLINKSALVAPDTTSSPTMLTTVSATSGEPISSASSSSTSSASASSSSSTSSASASSLTTSSSTVVPLSQVASVSLIDIPLNPPTSQSALSSISSSSDAPVIPLLAIPEITSQIPATSSPPVASPTKPHLSPSTSSSSLTVKRVSSRQASPNASPVAVRRILQQSPLSPSSPPTSTPSTSSASSSPSSTPSSAASSTSSSSSSSLATTSLSTSAASSSAASSSTSSSSTSSSNLSLSAGPQPIGAVRSSSASSIHNTPTQSHQRLNPSCGVLSLTYCLPNSTYEQFTYPFTFGLPTPQPFQTLYYQLDLNFPNHSYLGTLFVFEFCITCVEPSTSSPSSSITPMSSSLLAPSASLSSSLLPAIAQPATSLLTPPPSNQRRSPSPPPMTSAASSTKEALRYHIDEESNHWIISGPITQSFSLAKGEKKRFKVGLMGKNVGFLPVPVISIAFAAPESPSSDKIISVMNSSSARQIRIFPPSSSTMSLQRQEAPPPSAIASLSDANAHVAAGWVVF